MNPKQSKATRIWAVGGGKGGTGKSFLSASLGIEAGSRQQDVILVDADLGGPNLHTVLAVGNGHRDLGWFFRNDSPRLEDLLLDTPYPGLRFIKGGESSLFAANLHHLRKLKLIRQLKHLPASLIILDLGTGSAYHTLDLFLLGKPGILVVTPEPTAVENAYYFLRACAVRIIKLYAQFYQIPDLTTRLVEELETSSLSLRACWEKLRSLDARFGEIILVGLKNFRAGLVVNKAREAKDFLLGPSMVEVARRYFLVELHFLGTMPYDERAHWSLKKFVPFTRAHPEAGLSLAIKEMADRLLTGTGEVENDARPRFL